MYHQAEPSGWIFCCIILLQKKTLNMQQGNVLTRSLLCTMNSSHRKQNLEVTSYKIVENNHDAERKGNNIWDK